MVDPTQFYLSLDPQLFIDSFKAELQFVSNSWKMVGRPTIIFPVGRSLLGSSSWVASFRFIQYLDSIRSHSFQMSLVTFTLT